jgi:hypothetical protein
MFVDVDSVIGAEGGVSAASRVTVIWSCVGTSYLGVGMSLANVGVCEGMGSGVACGAHAGSRRVTIHVARIRRFMTRTTMVSQDATKKKAARLSGSIQIL